MLTPVHAEDFIATIPILRGISAEYLFYGRIVSVRKSLRGGAE